MKISELRPMQGNVEVSGIIKEVGEPRTFSKFGKNLTIVNCMLEDDSGSVKLSLWNDDAGRFKEGDVVKITNGYVNEFQGEKQLTSGKFGKIEKITDSVTKNEEPVEEMGDEPIEEEFF
ncbi:MAG: OB-fold nucleic acid binding domain-containing protein [Candidatus Pacearchaeota archaeon]|jgi:replication factor A1